MMEKLGAEDEARVSSWAFVLHFHSGSLDGHLAKNFLGGIVGFGGILARFWKIFFFKKDFRRFLEERRGRGVSKVDLGDLCQQEAWS